MPDITSLESLDRALLQVSGTPKVLEALWDGDTHGWYLCVSVYAEEGRWLWKRTVCHALGTVALGGDIRLGAALARGGVGQNLRAANAGQIRLDPVLAIGRTRR